MKKSEEFEFWGKTAIDFAKLTYAGGLLFAVTYWLTNKIFAIYKFIIVGFSSLMTIVVLLFIGKIFFQKSIKEDKKYD